MDRVGRLAGADKRPAQQSLKKRPSITVSTHDVHVSPPDSPTAESSHSLTSPQSQ